MIISLIAAVDEKWGIGKDNRMPWHLPSDLKRFKALTMGHHLVMGRKTFEAVGRPLPGRELIVVTRQQNYAPAGVFVAHSLEEALEMAEKSQESEVFIIGGGEIFRQALSMADRIYLTIVQAKVGADVSFPAVESDQWNLILAEGPSEDKQDEYESEFRILERKE